MAKKKQVRINSSRWYDIPDDGGVFIGIYLLEFQEVEAPPEPKYKVGDTFEEEAWADPTTYEVVSDPLMGEGGDYGKYYYHLKVSNGESIWYDTFREPVLDTVIKTN